MQHREGRVRRIEVILLDRRDVTPAGAAESPITVVAPAMGAALLDFAILLDEGSFARAKAHYDSPSLLNDFQGAATTRPG